jgi:hypothetical protein
VAQLLKTLFIHAMVVFVLALAAWGLDLSMGVLLGSAALWTAISAKLDRAPTRDGEGG